MFVMALARNQQQGTGARFRAEAAHIGNADADSRCG